MKRTQGFARSLLDPTVTWAPLVTVGVYNVGYDGDPTQLVPIFADNEAVPTPKANPFLSDVNGIWFFYVANGHYDIAFSGGTPPITPYAEGDVYVYEAP